jgi:hypothetical protein
MARFEYANLFFVMISMYNAFLIMLAFANENCPPSSVSRQR